MFLGQLYVISVLFPVQKRSQMTDLSWLWVKRCHWDEIVYQNGNSIGDHASEGGNTEAVKSKYLWEQYQG